MAYKVPLPDNEAQKAYQEFCQRRFRHPNLDTALEKLIRAIKTGKRGSIISLIGPTGVGKSTLLDILKQTLNEQDKDLLSDPGVIPHVFMEASAPDNGPFSWIEFYRDILEAMEEPLIDKKIARLVEDTRSSGHVLRRACMNAFEHRDTSLLVIDEAQHIGKGKGGNKLPDLTDYIKSLANKTISTRFVLAGTYELIQLISQGGQLRRRGGAGPIHLPRYRWESELDQERFRNIIYMIQQRLPFKRTIDLTQYAEYLFTHSVGCVGILKEWLDRAVYQAALSKPCNFDRSCLELTKLDQNALLRIMREIKDGEELSTAIEN